MKRHGIRSSYYKNLPVKTVFTLTLILLASLAWPGCDAVPAADQLAGLADDAVALRAVEEPAKVGRVDAESALGQLERPKVKVGHANLRPIDESGIAAKIKFVDDGTTLMVTGRAKGLDPAGSYLSNIYDIGSLPTGPGACAPTIFDPQDPDFILPTMFLGFWEVDQDGNGKLLAVNTNAGANFVPLDKIGTVSIRLFIAPPPAPGAPPVTELVACGPRAVSSSKVKVGRANLRPIDESGIAARIMFVDDGTTLMVTGKAKGLDPAGSYLSNIYDIGSFPSGPGACGPTIFDPQDPNFILPTMFLGFWEVDKDGNGKLFAVNTNAGADFVPLDKIGTVSIRLFIAPPPAPGAPPVTELVACGPRD